MGQPTATVQMVVPFFIDTITTKKVIKNGFYLYAKIHQCKEYAFFRIPKILMTEPYFDTLSTNAKLFYGLMLNRMSLSRKHGWIDENERVYIYFTLEDVCEQLCCKTDKAVKPFTELDADKGIGLIQQCPYDDLDKIVDLMLEVLCTQEDFIKIGSKQVYTALAKERFLKLNSDHIRVHFRLLAQHHLRYSQHQSLSAGDAVQCLRTSGNYYKAKVNHDFHELTLFPEDFPASRFPWLESKKIKGMSVTYGRKCSGLSKNLSRVGWLVRMYLESCKLPLPTLYRTWSVKVA